MINRLSGLQLSQSREDNTLTITRKMVETLDRETSRLEKTSPLILGSFHTAHEDKHHEIPLGRQHGTFLVWQDEVVDHDVRISLLHGGFHARQNLEAVLVRPIVKDGLQEVNSSVCKYASAAEDKCLKGSQQNEGNVIPVTGFSLKKSIDRFSTAEGNSVMLSSTAC